MNVKAYTFKLELTMKQTSLLKAGVAMALCLVIQTHAAMVSGIIELKTLSKNASDTSFSFIIADSCALKKTVNCSTAGLDFSSNAIGINSNDSGRLEEFWNITLDSRNQDVYGTDSIATGMADLQIQLDSLVNALQLTGNGDSLMSQVIWNDVTPGIPIEVITTAGNYGLLVPVGTYVGNGYTKWAFYWAYQDDGSANFFDSKIAGIRPTSKKVPQFVNQLLNQVGVDGLGRVRRNKLMHYSSLFNVPTKNTLKVNPK